ncbi:MAG: hydantoinase/oxoprolinase family protein [Firmicutes bacterium]|nr:hydantoinase/oxoprolinase family protein [Bacillota bacterium]
MQIGIGIDTGGTYTDAVIYDFDAKKILGCAKALTTKDDLSAGILEAIDGLPHELLKEAKVVSLSTTLATNACVEDRGGRAKLIFFGGDAKVIDGNGGKYGLPPSKEMLIQEAFTDFSGGALREPDWDLFRARISDPESGFGDLDGVGIIEMNAMRNGAVVEKRAKELFREKYGVPAVCGHELFSELNSLQRGAGALLNARLFPVIAEFLAAIKKALRARDIGAALVIVRSDGSLMSEEFASSFPVETLICGPAASATGGTRLTGAKNCIVVDMGGTTTDIAFVADGAPVTVTDGVSIGKWRTFVNGLYVRTFGLGGDSAVHYNDGGPFLEDYRVVPMCVAAARYPSVLEKLRELSLSGRKHTKYLYEHYIPVKDISGSWRHSGEEKALAAALKERPLTAAAAAEAIGKDIYSLNAGRLVRDGVVAVCGITPTDCMHVTGDFTRYCAEASLLAVEFAARSLGLSVGEFCGAVYSEVRRKLYLNIVKAALENRYPDYRKNGVGAEAERFINECYEAAKTGRRDPLIAAAFKTEYTVVGIGAPIGVFIKDVAETLGAEAIIPEHHEVANALGAVMGNVSASYDVEILPVNSPEGITGYTVHGSGGARVFTDLRDAEDFAAADAKAAAGSEAVRRGAKGGIAVTCVLRRNTAGIRGGAVYLGTTASAQAVGAAGYMLATKTSSE